MLYTQLCKTHRRLPLQYTERSALGCASWPFLPQMKIQHPFCSFQVKTLAREICINTCYLLPVSTEHTTVPVPFFCSSSKLWQQRTGGCSCTPELRATRCSATHLQGSCSSPLPFIFCAICSTQTSLYIEAIRRIPAIDQTSRHSPQIRDEDVEHPQYSVIHCLRFTALLLGGRCFTSHYPLHRL